MIFYATEKISAKRSRTPEGFLLVEATPIARTGMQLYSADELRSLQLQPSADGTIEIIRRPEEVFAPIAIASANGKPFVNEHPRDFVDTKSWRQLSLGHIMNPRQGTGDAADLLVADLLVCDQHAIDLIDAGKTELSCGYNCDYFALAPGKGEQRNIVINHVALVDEGRCGERCAIGDRNVQTLKETGTMKFKDWLKKNFGDAGVANPTKFLDEDMPAAAEPVVAGEGDTHVHVHMPGGVEDEPEDPMVTMGNRIGALEDGMKGFTDIAEWVRGQKEADDKAKDATLEEPDGTKKDTDMDDEASMKETEEETGDKVTDAKTSDKLSQVFQNTIALAEILAPGLKVPTMDAAKPLGATLGTICKHRLAALKAAWATKDGQALIGDIMGTATLDTGKLTCGKVRTVFLAAAHAKRQANNSGGTVAVLDMKKLETVEDYGGIRTVEDLNKRAKELWPMRSATAKR